MRNCLKYSVRNYQQSNKLAPVMFVIFELLWYLYSKELTNDILVFLVSLVPICFVGLLIDSGKDWSHVMMLPLIGCKKEGV